MKIGYAKESQLSALFSAPKRLKWSLSIRYLSEVIFSKMDVFLIKNENWICWRIPTFGIVFSPKKIKMIMSIRYLRELIFTKMDVFFDKKWKLDTVKNPNFRHCFQLQKVYNDHVDTIFEWRNFEQNGRFFS